MSLNLQTPRILKLLMTCATVYREYFRMVNVDAAVNGFECSRLLRTVNRFIQVINYRKKLNSLSLIIK